ncbi:2,3-bisphosphoglycerate-independent phosphoglycerate mutase [Candidatus Odyssella acanthamoebae]|uniref:2,3-bisphosphoglycerate-independent phosphoglycerate mutase n=1 Tax=Candidatus Odyssella acanthamoebae TaxID=91604 RepID=A0A077AVA2_9PROT|nr:2,3-bisphosphoglycerate-independent phosphoglycerate mutase [Candidatus Paracaedibacter acanthamoebae]AIK95959.1 phosphoglyceromutase [Candidatus Paracaedibacter acanthamoebae]
MKKQKALLCILDGWGIRNAVDYNGIALAHTPTWDRMLLRYPHSQLTASETSVGLPQGQMGNSEVGHTTIGSGRVVMQELPRIDHAIENNFIPEMPAWQNFIFKASHAKGVVHVMGLLSDGGVHSYQDHIIYLAKQLVAAGLSVKVHAWLDGRDTPPTSAIGYIKSFMQATSRLDIELVTIGGRYFGMDRDKRWDRIETAVKVMGEGDGKLFADPIDFINKMYKKGIHDEFIEPHKAYGYNGIQPGDSLLAANFRADRVRQILSVILKKYNFSATLGMVEYSAELTPLIPALFAKQEIKNTLGELVSRAGLTQLRVAETEKYAHVTFFLNGGREDVYPGENRHLIQSPQVATYDLKPEMSAHELTDFLVSDIESGQHDLIVCNYANPDMVGHTGVQEAIIKAVETIDTCLHRLEAAAISNGYQMIVTADHGNVEVMVDQSTGQPHTAHTLNPVPFVLINNDQVKQVLAGGLEDIAPTVLTLMGLHPALEMTGKVLIEK